MNMYSEPKARILMVGPTPPPFGGMAVQTEALVQKLSEKGHTVILCSTSTRLPLGLGRIRFVRGLLRLSVLLITLARHAKSADCVHIMANSYGSWYVVAKPTIWIAHWYRKRIVLNYRGGHAPTFFKKHIRYIKKDLNKVHTIVVPSAYLAQTFQQFGFSSTVIPNAVDTQVFSPQQKPMGMRCFIARNLEFIYGVDVALHAIALLKSRYPRLELMIAGEGGEKLKLLALVKQLKLEKQVTFVGRLDRQTMVRYYAKTDILLNPARIDNMPNALLEAQACGVPIVSTNVGGIPFMVEHEKTALLVRKDCPQQMAQAIAQLLDNSALREQLISAGLAAAQTKSWPQVEKLWSQVYDKEVDVA